jgi:ribulose bisphosphate carboxylase small subunit
MQATALVLSITHSGHAITVEFDDNCEVVHEYFKLLHVFGTGETSG